MPKYNPFFEIIRKFKKSESPALFDPFTKELHKYPDLRKVMKIAEQMHILDKTNNTQMALFNRLKTSGVLELNIEGQYFVHPKLSRIGEILMNHYVDLPEGTGGDYD